MKTDYALYCVGSYRAGDFKSADWITGHEKLYTVFDCDVRYYQYTVPVETSDDDFTKWAAVVFNGSFVVQVEY